MELNSQVNTFSKGMNLDADISLLPEGQYRYAENIRIVSNENGTTGVLQNIEHIRQYTNGIPKDEKILGTAITRIHDDETNGTIECGIVLTKKIDNIGIYNTIYKVTSFTSEILTIEPLLKGRLNIANQVSIVTNYESNNVSNIYICDGDSPIKVINIYDINPEEEVNDPTKFDITPGCVLLPFTFVNTINGSLPAGAIQYCYQLFNMHGSETTTSALSEVIPITKHDTNGASDKIKGQLKEELSNRGCQIKARFKNDGRFDRARIFSIIYLDNISIPDIYIVNEVQIPQMENNEFVEFTYSDTGASFLSKITIDEFNAMIPFEFTAKTIEKMSNRLFAANVQELTWDVEFDARAYRCDKFGSITLDSSDERHKIVGKLNADGTITNEQDEIITIDEEHDCINPSNTDLLDVATYQYGYDQDGNIVRGGTGPNVSYRFVYTELVNSDQNVEGKNIAANLKLDAKPCEGDIYTFFEDGKTLAQNTQPLPKNGTRAAIPNYSDPYICANYLGYRRDEIYRFGIIFYNKKNIPSPVHWIGDIRMPSINDVSDESSVIHPFHLGRYSNSYGETKELVSYALGIQFRLLNVPIDAKSYEIVRCDREEQNRTVLTQGILGALFKFDDWGKFENNSGDYDMRPAPMFNLADNFKTDYYHGSERDQRDSHTAVSNYFEFVSPEICISKQLMESSLQNKVLCPLFKVCSTVNGNVAIPQNTIQNIAADGSVKNDDAFGFVRMHDGVIRLNMGYGGGKEYHSDYYGYAGVFKYYTIIKDTDIQNTSFDIDECIIGETLPYRIDLQNTKNYAQFIGNYTYINTSIGGYRQFSNHGINAVLHTEGLSPHSSPKGASGFCTAIIANIKQNIIPYGGNTYVSRQNSIYNSCGCFSEAGQLKVICYGGDTYLNVLDYLNTSVIQQDNDVRKELKSRLCCVCYIPLESQVNLNMRSDDSYHRLATAKDGPNLIQNEPVVMPNGWVQKKPYYEYNPVYSATSGSKQYVSKSIYAEDNQINQNRIVSSELKTNNEITDSWTKFKFANYIDVDSQYGQITNLKAINNKLYYWQDNAVGIASVNERSLITDNNMAELTLGTGGILTRFDNVVTLNGSSIVNDKSIIKSLSAVYWYDFDKNEICVLGDGMQVLSKVKSVQSHLNKLPNQVKKHVVSMYDKKYNEVWFKLYDNALIYNEQIQQFTSFYTHDFGHVLQFSNKLVTIKNNDFYLHNVYEVTSENKKEHTSKLQFVVNKDIMYTKVFDNVMFDAYLLDNDNEIPQIIKDVSFKTKTQETDVIDFNDIDLREDNYRFAIPREKVSDENMNTITSKSYLGRMRGKYLICDYTFDCNNNREFKLPFIKTTYRYSML